MLMWTWWWDSWLGARDGKGIPKASQNLRSHWSAPALNLWASSEWASPHEMDDNVALEGYAKLLAASLDDAPHTFIDSAPALQRYSGKLVPMRME